MKNKFRTEKHIDQIYSDKTNTWSFRVRLKGINKTFSEKEYLDPSVAFKMAKKYRDEILANNSITKIVGTNNKLYDVLLESFDIIPTREQTQKKYKCMFNKYIHSDKKITKLTKEDIILSLNAMIENASDDTINRVFFTYRRIVKTAIIKDYIQKDITYGIVPPKSHYIVKEKREKITDKETINLVANLCSEKMLDSFDREQYPLMLWFLYHTGCRPCEMFALLKSDIHNDYISINKEIGSSLTENNVVRQCKTPLSNRNIPITDGLKDIIEKSLKLSKNDILFPTKNGGYHNSTKVGDNIRHLCKKRNIEFNMYQIRHLFSTDLERNGIDPRTHQELMGHKNYTMSINYARSNIELKKKALEKR